METPQPKKNNVRTLVGRCRNLKVLSLDGISVTDNALDQMIQHLKWTLEELDYATFGINILKVKELLESMPKLKSLNICDKLDEGNTFRKLKKKFPVMKINEDCLHVAAPHEPLDSQSGLWEIVAKKPISVSKIFDKVG